jgi:hypothetical protein
MNKVARILTCVLVAVFMAGTAAHGAITTGMSLEMSKAAMDDGGMPDCQDCPGDDQQASVCSQFCITTLIAICPPPSGGLPHVAAIVPSLPAEVSYGRIGPPDPYPPRFIL